MQQNTSPTVIQDKNGKTTTVHRKNISSTVASVSDLPAPSLSIAAPTTTEEALRDLSELGIDLPGSSFGVDNIAYLAGYPKVLHAVIESIKESDEDTKKDIWAFKLGEQSMHPDYEGDNHDYRSNYWRMIKTIPFGKALFPDMDANDRRRHLDRVVGLSERGMGWWPAAKKYTEVQAAMIAIVASGKFSNFEFKGRMSDIFYMADNLEKVIPLIPEILKRGDSSREYVEALINNEAKALSDGVL